MNEITLNGSQNLDGEFNFQNVKQVCTSLSDYNDFYKEIKENAQSMWSSGFREKRIGTFGFKFWNACDGDYEEWTEVNKK